KVYTSWAQGLKATVDTLKNYPSILAALKAGVPVSAFSSAVAASPWGTGAINASGVNVGNAALQKLMDQVAKGTSSAAAKKATYGPSQNVEKMLTLAEQLVGAPYSK